MMATDSEPIDADFKPLAVRDEPAPVAPSMFGTADPVEIVEKAVRVADALKSVIVAKNLIANIGGKAYPQVEAWLTLASMLRLTTVCEWSRPVDNGWEARVFVRDAMNNVIGAAEAQCLKTERSKKSWEDYAIRSMAQTRATSKALRSVLGFIMVLAGYQATPAEEMPDTPSELPVQIVATVDDYKAAWLAKGAPEGSGKAFMAKHGGTIASAMAALAKYPDAAAVAEAFALDPEPAKPTLQAVPDNNEDPLAKERRRMRAIVKERGISDAVRKSIILRMFSKTSSSDLTFAQLVVLNGELQEYRA